MSDWRHKTHDEETEVSRRIVDRYTRLPPTSPTNGEIPDASPTMALENLKALADTERTMGNAEW